MRSQSQRPEHFGIITDCVAHEAFSDAGLWRDNACWAINLGTYCVGDKAPRLSCHDATSSPSLIAKRQITSVTECAVFRTIMSLTFSHISADGFEEEARLKAGRKRSRMREAVSCSQVCLSPVPSPVPVPVPVPLPLPLPPVDHDIVPWEENPM